MRLQVKVPGSCGELVQGMFNGEPFLITCPINLFSTVTISDESNEMIGLGWKSEAMLSKVLKYLDRENFDFSISLKSELPIGKGMASSSADIAAIGKAAALALGFELTAEEIAALASSIEPTDGVFYEGIVAMNPLTGQIFSKVAPLPEYKILVFDFGGEIDTITFERRSNFHLKKLPKDFDLTMTTASALANQSILHKPQLEDIVNFALPLGALGFNTAHTGTVIGVIFAENTSQKHLTKYSNAIIKNFPHIKFVAAVTLISGGFHVIRD